MANQNATVEAFEREKAAAIESCRRACDAAEAEYLAFAAEGFQSTDELAAKASVMKTTRQRLCTERDDWIALLRDFYFGSERP